MPFIEIEDSILLAMGEWSAEKIAAFSNAKKSRDLSIESLESSYNFVEVSFLFTPEGRDIDENECEVLAGCIRGAWDGQLKLKYPHRHFIVEVLPPEETGSTVGVHFYEKR